MSGAGGAGCSYPLNVGLAPRGGKNEKRKFEPLIGLGVGIVIEGLIGYAMFKILPPWEAVNSFLLMLLASAILGAIIFLLYVGDKDKREKLWEQS